MSTPFDHEATIPEGEHPLLAGRYRVVRRLGAGGMGEVHLVEDLKLDGRQFAVKLLPSFLAANKRAIAGLKREALHAMELSHSHIVTVRGFEEMESGQPFLVMDYVDGETLEEMLLERERMSEAEVTRIFGPIAEALDYAHGRGVIHRDVKPSNIMIRRDGTPLIMDFGIAREAKETSTLVTGRESTSGTLPYMSPEQLRGKKPEASQDIYSLAATMWECLAGEPPFSRGDLRHQILEEMPEPPSDLDGLDFADSLIQGLSKAPEDRPESCGGLLGETGPVSAGQGATPSPTKPNSPGKKPRSATDLVELESHVRILQREAKAALDDGDPLPPEYAAKFEQAGHFVESAKENKAARLWSDAASVLELASGIYKEIRTARSPYDALRESQTKIEEIDAALMETGAELELDDLPQEQAHRAARAEFDVQIEESVTVFDWPVACEAANAIIELSSEHRKWVHSLQAAREETLHALADVAQINDELVSLGTEAELGDRPRFEAFRSERTRLDGALALQMKSGDWMSARTTSELIRALAVGHRSWIRTVIKTRDEYLVLQREIDGLIAATAEINSHLGSEFELPPSMRENLSGQEDLKTHLEAHVSGRAWKNAVAEARILHRLASKALREAEACRQSVTEAIKAAAARRRWYGALAATASGLVAMAIFVLWLLTPLAVSQVGAGGSVTFAVLADGSVACWGSNKYAQCTVPSGVGTPANPAVQVAAGFRHTVSVLSDGSVACWGYNGGGQCTVPSGVGTPANSVVQVAAGNVHTVAVLSDGSVACWGANASGQCAVPSGVGTPANPVVQVAAGSLHTVAVLSDGSVACWGSNDSGQCTVPSGVGTPVNPVVQVAAGDSHTAAVLSDGSVACWGNNGSGRFAVPSGVGTPWNPVKQVAAGRDHTVALLSDGSVACWGRNGDGQCTVPRGVGTPTRPVVQVAAGSIHTVAVLSDGSVACWGRTANGQCTVPKMSVTHPGDGPMEASRLRAAKLESERPAARAETARVEAARVEAARVEAARVEAARVALVRGIKRVQAGRGIVSAGYNHTVAVLSDGSVACWGYNFFGRCTVPSGVGTPANPVVQVAAGSLHTVAVLSDGSVACWGDNSRRQCEVPSGVGTPANPVVQVAAGEYYTVAVLSDGSVACWGYKFFGQCTVPSGVDTPANPVVQVAAGANHTVALLTDGSVACWGRNSSGQCTAPRGVGTPVNPVVQVAAGNYHTVAVLLDGSVACWGRNGDGQCTVPSGVGTPANPVVEVAAGNYYTVAVLSDGSVACWGNNGSGRCTVPSSVGTPANPVVQVATGDYHTVAVLSDGSVACWGMNDDGQCSPPDGLRVRLPE